MKITIFGAGGDVGSRLVSETLTRGHDVTAVLRTPASIGKIPQGANVSIADVADTEQIARLVKSQDLVISAVRPPEGQEKDMVGLTASVLKACSTAGVRVLVVGGAASLKLSDRPGYTVLTAPGFLPDEYKPIALASQAQFELCMADSDVDVTYMCPPAMLEPGERLGHYRTGGDTLLTNEDGDSRISMEDFAVALLDEAERPRHKGGRFTVAY
ncbi:NAD(P)-dependent oxidoreductase [Emcibacter sp.]|uniref:NAD(P)-dependent oxidoreductase n=1 Tax=Emcibacter sp. TaxID=1979954 RepID=UPI002AA7B8BB|nr:NAD(P)H-binding protein [Emcibacter sp.]